MKQKILESVEYIKQKYPLQPNTGIILGSGLGAFHEQLNSRVEIPYEEIPNFPVSTVEGHAGKLVLGKLHGKDLVVMSGRFHFYEGYGLEQVVHPVRVLAKLGIQNLIITNAAGGVNTAFVPGDLMIIEDHINLIGNPLIGPNDKDFGPRFPDMSKSYNPELQKLANDVAEKLGVDLKKGVYIAFTGPSYETPAEIRMVRILGADAVGMSTAPEVVAANHIGLKILGISCITNMAAGILDQPLTHEEVFETAEKTKTKFVNLIDSIIKEI